MTEKELGQTIKELSDMQFPENLHGKIMRQLVFLKFRTPFLVVVSLLSLNLFFVTWRTWQRFSDTEFIAFTSILLDNFEFTFDFASQLFATIIETTPWLQVMLFLGNVFLLGYIIHIPRMFKQLVKNG